MLLYYKKLLYYMVVYRVLLVNDPSSLFMKKTLFLLSASPGFCVKLSHGPLHLGLTLLLGCYVA